MLFMIFVVYVVFRNYLLSFNINIVEFFVSLKKYSPGLKQFGSLKYKKNFKKNAIIRICFKSHVGTTESVAAHRRRRCSYCPVQSHHTFRFRRSYLVVCRSIHEVRKFGQYTDYDRFRVAVSLQLRHFVASPSGCDPLSQALDLLRNTGERYT